MQRTVHRVRGNHLHVLKSKENRQNVQINANVYLSHDRVRRVHEVAGVAARRALETERAVAALGAVGHHQCRREATVEEELEKESIS